MVSVLLVLMLAVQPSAIQYQAGDDAGVETALTFMERVTMEGSPMVEDTMEVPTRIPGTFIENMGQVEDAAGRYYSRGDSFSVSFCDGAIVFYLRGADSNGWTPVHILLEGASHATPTGVDRLEGVRNYIIGSSPEDWVTGVPAFGSVAYRDAWEGLDLVFRMEGGSLKYDVLVKPGARVEDLRLRYDGALSLVIDPATGDLLVRTEAGTVRDTAPWAVQELPGSGPASVECSFRMLDGDGVGFHLGEHASDLPVLIDPGLEFSTFFGEEVTMTDLHIADDGSYYVCGITGDDALPGTTGSYCESYPGGWEHAFYAKFDEDCSDLLFCTYFGGNFLEYVGSIDVDDQGRVAISGYSASWSGLPTTSNAYKRTNDYGVITGLIAVFSSDGTDLVYGTYMGGSALDLITDVKFGPGGVMWAVGASNSSDFPTTANALEKDWQGGLDMVIQRYSTSDFSMEFSTFMGGSSDDGVADLLLDGDGDPVMVGSTGSSGFPTSTGAYCETISGPMDGVLLKLKRDCSGVIFSTLFGGDMEDDAVSLVLDGSENIWLAGATNSTDLPVTGEAIQDRHGGGDVDAYVAHLSADGRSLLYGTYIGGKGDPLDIHIALDDDGRPVVVLDSDGGQVCPNTAIIPEHKGEYDAHVAWLDPDNGRILNATYLGGDDDDYTYGIDVNDDGVILVFGSTQSSDFPTTLGAHDTTHGSSDGYIAGITFEEAPYDPPGTPRNLTATPGDKLVELTWRPPADMGVWPFSGYRVYKGTTGTDLELAVEVSELTAYTFANLRNGQTYYFQVSCFGLAGEGALTPVVEALPYRDPSAPLNLTLEPGGRQVRLTWEEPEETGGLQILNYEIYRAVGEDALEFLILVGNVTEYVDISVTGGILYRYAIRAFHVKGHGPFTETLSVMPWGPPMPPSNVRLMTASERVVVMWDPPLNDGGGPIVAYHVLKGQDAGDLHQICATSELMYRDEDVVNGRTYYYALRARNAAGSSPDSSVLEATPRGPPSAPRSLNVTGGDSQVTLRWEKPSVSGGYPVSDYRVYRGTVPNDVTRNTWTGSVLTFTDTDITNGVTYYYRVLAMNQLGEGPLSDIVSITPYGTPRSPQSVAASAGDREAVISWLPHPDDGGSPVTAFVVSRGTSEGGPWSQVAEVNADARSYRDGPLTNGLTYYYVVHAVSGVGRGPYSSMASVMPIGPPDAPRDLVVTAGEENASLSWSPPVSLGGSEPVEYVVYRGTTDSDLAVKAITGNETVFLDEELAPGVTYYYAVALRTQAGEGQRTEAVNATPWARPCCPSFPLGVTAKSDDGTVTVRWERPASSGSHPISGYVVLRGEHPSRLQRIADVGPDILEYTDGDASPGEVYFYSVAAVNEIGQGEVGDVLEIEVTERNGSPGMACLGALAALGAAAALCRRRTR